MQVLALSSITIWETHAAPAQLLTLQVGHQQVFLPASSGIATSEAWITHRELRVLSTRVDRKRLRSWGVVPGRS